MLTKENACKTVNDQPIVKVKKFQREMFPNAFKTVEINVLATEKRKSMKVTFIIQHFDCGVMKHMMTFII